MKSTADHILDVAQDLIQTRGYTAMSFQDIAERVGIKKPTIVHHFPSKQALGEAVIRRYRQEFDDALNEVMHAPDRSARDALEFYFSPYLEYGKTPNKVCLCGALAGEAMVLSAEMRAEVALFFRTHQEWLAGIMRRGEETGEFKLADHPEAMAQLLFSALQGALLIKRSVGELSQLKRVIAAIRASLKPA